MFLYGYAYSLLFLTIHLSLVVISIRAIWLAVVPPRRCVKEASCEKCKYPVAGLSTWTCPECGSQLLTVGIVTRSMEMRRRGSYAGAIAGAGFLLLAVGFVASFINVMTLGAQSGVSGGTVQVVTVPVTETANALPPLLLVVENDWTSSSPLIGKVRLASGATFDELRLEFANGRTYERLNVSGDVAAAGVFDLDTLLQWTNDSGVNVTDPQATKALQELDSYLVSSNLSNLYAGAPMTAADLPSFAIGSLAITTRPAFGNEQWQFWFEVVMWTIPSFGLLLFILFTFLINRRRRKLLRDAESPPLSPPPAAA